jgi:hypothetical protein
MVLLLGGVACGVESCIRIRACLVCHCLPAQLLQTDACRLDCMYACVRALRSCMRDLCMVL